MKGYFITFEGIDGCGKSTQAKLLAQRLIDQGLPVITTREPGGTIIAEKIRALLIDPQNSEMVNECELLLYLAARTQHVHEKIIPELERGSIIIGDRFQDATFAYQGFGRSLSMKTLRELNHFATGGINPDCTFIFDIPVEIAFERLNAMNKSADRLEAGGRDFFERIRHGYQTLSVEEPDRITFLDGTLPREQLADNVFVRIAKKLEKLSFL